jgi:hypothetical protein
MERSIHDGSSASERFHLPEFLKKKFQAIIFWVNGIGGMALSGLNLVSEI